MDLDLVGQALIVLGAALVCSGSVFMLRSRSPRPPLEEDSEAINNPVADAERSEEPPATEDPTPAHPPARRYQSQGQS
jgi:hypothetical protein